VHSKTRRDTSTETPEKFSEIARLYRQTTAETMPVAQDNFHQNVS
jgi:hypothetical protein